MRTITDVFFSTCRRGLVLKKNNLVVCLVHYQNNSLILLMFRLKDDTESEVSYPLIVRSMLMLPEEVMSNSIA